MKTDYWLNKWKTGDIFFHQEAINYYLPKYFHLVNLKKNETILVPLCGKSLDLCWFAQQEFNVIGIELSPIACDDFFLEMQVKPTITAYHKFILYQYQNIKILCGDFFDLTPEDLPPIHAIYDCKALIALPSDVRKKYVQHLLQCTGKDIKIFLITIDTKDLVKSPPFPIHTNELNELFGENFNIQLLYTHHTNNISQHLKNNGFKEIIETITLITPR